MTKISDTTTFKCQGECKREKHIVNFSFVGRKNQKDSRRKVCNSCHGRRCYQTRLRHAKFKGDERVKTCHICKELFRVKSSSVCLSCRKKLGRVNYYGRKK